MGHTERISHAIFLSPNLERLASGGHDKTIKIWDYKTNECLITLIGHSKMVFSLAICAS